MTAVPPSKVRASRRRMQPGLLRTTASFAQPLGSHIVRGAVRGYYIDLRAKAEDGHWPPHWWWPDDEQQYIDVAQAALGYLERYVAGEGEQWLDLARRTGDYLIDHQQRGGRFDGGWWHHWAYPHTYDVRPPWLSAMAQGEAASALVRLYLETGDERFADAALRAMKPMRIPVGERGVLAELDGGPFLEETPTSPSSLILNGAIFALWGCYDVGIGLEDGPSLALFRSATETLAANLHRWDTGSWSRYDLYRHPLVNVANPFYHRLHIDQLRAMQLLYPDPRVAATLTRFESYAASRPARLRAYGHKVLFRVVSPRSRRLARRLPWAQHPAL